jgi:hypothetical protein
MLGTSPVLAQSRCGGDGPQPFNDLDLGTPKATRIVIGQVEEFQFWESRNTLIYRNDRNQIYSYEFQNKWGEYFGNSQIPLSPVVDPSERAILLDRTPYFFLSGYWRSFYLPVQHPKHLFWDRRFLYMLENLPGTAKTSQELRIHTHKAGTNSSRFECRYYVPVGEQYLEGQGASFPVVPFYKVRATPQGNELTLLEMDARTCNVTIRGVYKDPFEGKILSVHRFDTLRSYAVQTDHPTKNLMWDYYSGCEFFDIGKSTLLVPNHSRAIVATWNPAAGLELMNLTTRNRSLYYGPDRLAKVRPRDIALSTQGNRLFFAPDSDSPSISGRHIYEIDVKGLFP